MTGKDATEVLSIDAHGIERAADLLIQGQIVAVPTETVYGLAARADSNAAVARIFAAKGRPSFNPLIVHVRDLSQAQDIAEFDERALDLVERFWPGPLTLVLPLRDDASIATAVTAGLSTVALRQPAHPVMQAVLGKLPCPLAAPSANRSEEISPTKPEHVIASLGDACPAIIAGGVSQRGLESTIIALRANGGWSLLRPGPISLNSLQRILGPETTEDVQSIEAPGQLARHYSPGKPLRLNVSVAKADEFLIGFGNQVCDCNLSQSGDLNEAAARLYHCLHIGAASSKGRIAVAPIPGDEIGLAINDRLRRAAAD